MLCDWRLIKGSNEAVRCAPPLPRKVGLGEAIATRAGHTRPDDAVHDRAARNIFRLFGYIFAKAAQFATALSALCVAQGQFDFHARNVIRDRLALRLVGGCILGQAQLCRKRGDGDLRRFQRQLQLVGYLGGCPEPMGAMAHCRQANAGIR
mgnify:CR=1 FL=1